MKVSYKSITALQAIIPLETPVLFSNLQTNSNSSPLDQFLTNANSINRIYLSASSTLSPELGSLVLLGYMSAVESFFRTLVRKLINIDECTRNQVLDRRVTFGAALHHTADLLPDALLEDISFAGKSNIEKMLSDYIGLFGKPPSEIKTALDEFHKICELRHCCVHRFGKLGASNAIRLGLDTHSTALEMSFSPSNLQLQEISDSLRTFVKALNNYIFQSVLERTAAHQTYEKLVPSIIWHWKFPTDRRHFRPYYDLFSSHSDAPASPSLKEIYYSFRDAVQSARRARSAQKPYKKPST